MLDKGDLVKNVKVSDEYFECYGLIEKVEKNNIYQVNYCLTNIFVRDKIVSQNALGLEYVENKKSIIKIIQELDNAAYNLRGFYDDMHYKEQEYYEDDFEEDCQFDYGEQDINDEEEAEKLLHNAIISAIKKGIGRNQIIKLVEPEYLKPYEKYFNGSVKL